MHVRIVETQAQVVENTWDFPEDGSEPVPGPDVDQLEQLAHLIPALWRTIKRAARSSEELPTNESHIGILRMLILHGELAPARLAQLLNLARPTVSNMLKPMIANGLIERSIHPDDTRNFVISVTAQGGKVLENFRADRVSLLRAASSRMSEDDQVWLRDSVPTFRRLLRQLEKVAEESAERSGNA